MVRDIAEQDGRKLLRSRRRLRDSDRREAPHDEAPTRSVSLTSRTGAARGFGVPSKRVTVASTSDRYVLLRRYEMNCAAALAATQPKGPISERRVLECQLSSNVRGEEVRRALPRCQWPRSDSQKAAAAFWWPRVTTLQLAECQRAGDVA